MAKTKCFFDIDIGSTSAGRITMEVSGLAEWKSDGNANDEHHGGRSVGHRDARVIRTYRLMQFMASKDTDEALLFKLHGYYVRCMQINDDDDLIIVINCQSGLSATRLIS